MRITIDIDDRSVQLSADGPAAIAAAIDAGGPPAELLALLGAVPARSGTVGAPTPGSDAIDAGGPPAARG